MADNPSALNAYLHAVKKAARQLSETLEFYQLAITSARAAGATWEQLSTAADIPTATARSRHRTAVQGGEMHLHLDPLVKITDGGN